MVNRTGSERTRVNHTGSERTRAFYDEKGWQLAGGITVDRTLFGNKEDGPIRTELDQIHVARIKSALSWAGVPLDFLECGCGAQPAMPFLDLCARYTGVDFSETGLQLAQSLFSNLSIPYQFHKADVCSLPFSNEAFDAVYSAHMIYHIDDKAAQAEALAELMRVIRPGGVLVLVTANPYPLLFPVRLLRRLLKSTPIVGPVLDHLRSRPPLPYRPMTIGWMRRQLRHAGDVNVIASSLPSTDFNRDVTEFRGLGKLAWKAIRWLDIGYPRLLRLPR